MSYFDDASLVFIPSGYKTSKAYSVKPIDGSGDLTFTRSNDTATRVNSAGLIEKVRTNVVTYSQDFSDASWTKTAITLSTSATANPVNGALTAQDAIPTAVSSSHRIFKLAGVVSAANTWSIFAKAKGYNFITIVENGNTSASVSFNLSTGAVSTQISAVGQIQSLGNGWYRCSMIHTTAATPRFDVYVSPTDSISAYTADGTSGVTLFGAQAEASDFGATPYIATTTAAVSVGPVANVPRLDYLNSSCPRLLLEGQRTNSILWSENFDNATWVKIGTTVTANNAVSPDGYTNADALVENTATSLHDTYQAFVSSSSTAYTFSCYIKPSTRTRAYLRSDTSAGTVRTLFDLTGSGSVVTLNHTSASISLVGNGWYRCSITFTEGTGAVGRLLFVEGAVGTSVSYAGNGLTAFWIYGAQLEAGAYATSYIPTLGSASTRGSDAASKTGVSSLIGQTEGTMFLDVIAQVDTAESQDFSISDGTANNRASIRLNNSGLINAVGVFGGSVQFSMGTGAYVTGQRYKIALAYKLNDVVLYVNGVQSATDTSATISGTLSRLGFDVNTTGTQNLKSRVNQTLLFKTRLTNSELAALTTL